MTDFPCLARRAATAALLALAASGGARAQLSLPRTPSPAWPATPAPLRPPPLQPLPSLPTPPTPPVALPAASAVEAAVPLDTLRRQAAADLIARHPEQVEAAPDGAPVRRGELLLVAPSPTLVAAARAAGYRVLRDEALDGLDLALLVVAPPPGLGTAAALARLRALDPALEADFNHLYAGGGALQPPAPASAAPPAPDTGPTARPAGGRVGLIDGGVDRAHPALRAADLHAWGCDGAVRPGTHGTAVASLLVGHTASFAGAAPGLALYAADVYCGQPAGGASDEVARALAWLVRERVAVVNVSLVGPPNRLLERAVQAVVARGHLIVAAVGNDGPAAPPLYPAAYPGVVGVTGVDPARRVLPEALRGPQVRFAAPGSELAVAAAGETGYASARGTSFAAPLVAGLLARRLPAPDPAAAAAALDALAREAIDLGAPGPDATYGRGLVGEALRTAPARVAADGRALRP